MNTLAITIILVPATLAGLGLLVGCTVPCYERTVVKTYDGQGVLQSAVVAEHVRQIDPNARPLLKAIEDQTYQKQP
jgi:hypothetical protein